MTQQSEEEEELQRAVNESLRLALASPQHHPEAARIFAPVSSVTSVLHLVGVLGTPLTDCLCS